MTSYLIHVDEYGHALIRALVEEHHRDTLVKVEKTRERWQKKSPGSTRARRRYLDACAAETRASAVVAFVNHPITAKEG